MATKNSAQSVTKKERRDMARERARILREQEAKRARRNKALMIGGIVLAVALVVFAILQIVGKGGKANTGDYEGTVRPATLANVTDDYGIDVNAAGVAGQVVEDAGVFAVYSDYTCSGCINLERNYADTYHNHADAGELSVRLYPVATLNNSVSDNAAAAMFYVATYAPEQAWAYNDALFARTAEAVKGGGSAPTLAEFADIAKSVGVPDDVANDLPASVASDDWKAVAVAATDSFREKGYTATPTLEVNGVVDDSWLAEGDVDSVIQSAIDAGAK
ncbi:DsbA family protein [Trueperella bernardiae]|uniref:DsbA family protein n=1 Tax=Trueperella bernardiae TaxID=59561 RepID=UPI00288AECD9|nr:thioredoxin domain-containing protein [Trueperella bernardiae]